MSKEFEMVEFLNKIEQFKLLDTIEFENIQKIINIRFLENPTSINKSYSIFTLDLENSIELLSGAEFRKPNDVTRNNEGLIELFMKSNCGITQDHIISLFGLPRWGYPPPNWVKNSLLYLLYDFNNLKLNFGFPFKGEDCLDSVVLNYFKKN